MPTYSGRMPTLPPGGAPLSGNEPHRARQVAESFGSDAERYDRARPRYPRAMVGRIVAASPGPGVLDVGIGTGIAARQFQAAGCRVLGVEVDARMAGLARRGGFEVEVAAFEAWDPAGRKFDAVVAGQTWHWVDPVAGAAKAAQALRAGGRLAVFWNAGQPPPDMTEAFAAVYRRVMPDLPFNPMGEARLGRVLGAVHQGSRRHPGDGRVRRPAAVAILLGTVLHPGPVAGPASHARRSHPAPAGAARGAAGGHRGRYRRDRGQLHDVLHRGGGHRGANRRRLTRL